MMSSQSDTKTANAQSSGDRIQPYITQILRAVNVYGENGPIAPDVFRETAPEQNIRDFFLYMFSIPRTSDKSLNLDTIGPSRRRSQQEITQTNIRDFFLYMLPGPLDFHMNDTAVPIAESFDLASIHNGGGIPYAVKAVTSNYRACQTVIENHNLGTEEGLRIAGIEYNGKSVLQYANEAKEVLDARRDRF